MGLLPARCGCTDGSSANTAEHISGDGAFWRKPSNRKCPAVSEVLPLLWINADSAASGSSTVAVLGPETGALT